MQVLDRGGGDRAVDGREGVVADQHVEPAGLRQRRLQDVVGLLFGEHGQVGIGGGVLRALHGIDKRRIVHDQPETGGEQRGDGRRAGEFEGIGDKGDGSHRSIRRRGHAAA